jgi:hypothetical protein
MVHAYCQEGGARSPALAVASTPCMSSRGLPQVPTSRGECAGDAVHDDAGEEEDEDPAVRRPRSGGSPSADMLMLTNGGMSSAQGSSLFSISRSPSSSFPPSAPTQAFSILSSLFLFVFYSFLVFFNRAHSREGRATLSWQRLRPNEHRGPVQDGAAGLDWVWGRWRGFEAKRPHGADTGRGCVAPGALAACSYAARVQYARMQTRVDGASADGRPRRRTCSRPGCIRSSPLSTSPTWPTRFRASASTSATLQTRPISTPVCCSHPCWLTNGRAEGLDAPFCCVF